MDYIQWMLLIWWIILPYVRGKSAVLRMTSGSHGFLDMLKNLYCFLKYDSLPLHHRLAKKVTVSYYFVTDGLNFLKLENGVLVPAFWVSRLMVIFVQWTEKVRNKLSRAPETLS